MSVDTLYDVLEGRGNRIVDILLNFYHPLADDTLRVINKITIPLKLEPITNNASKLWLRFSCTEIGNSEFALNQFINWLKFLTHRHCTIEKGLLESLFNVSEDDFQSHPLDNLKNVKKRMVNIQNKTHASQINSLDYDIDEKLKAHSLTDLKELRIEQYNLFMRCIDLYGLSLKVSEINHSLSYLLLLNIIETIAQTYSDLEITLDLYEDEKKKFDNLVNEKLELDKIKELEKMVIGTRGIGKKFVDIFQKLLPDSFFEKRKEVKKNDLSSVLKTIYSLRSQFVHSGQFIPKKIANIYNKSGILRYNENGVIKLVKVPTLEWFEDAIHEILIEFLHLLKKNKNSAEDKKRYSMKDQIVHNPSIFYASVGN